VAVDVAAVRTLLRDSSQLDATASPYASSSTRGVFTARSDVTPLLLQPCIPDEHDLPFVRNSFMSMEDPGLGLVESGTAAIRVIRT
jgi:hypothetical protein